MEVEVEVGGDREWGRGKEGGWTKFEKGGVDNIGEGCHKIPPILVRNPLPIMEYIQTFKKHKHEAASKYR